MQHAMIAAQIPKPQVLYEYEIGLNACYFFANDVPTNVYSTDMNVKCKTAVMHLKGGMREHH